MDEITITREDLLASLEVHLVVLRQKKPHLLRGLAALKDERGYTDREGENKALTAFAEDIADSMTLSSKRIVRDRNRAPNGMIEQTNAEVGIEPRPDGRGSGRNGDAVTM